MERFPKQKLIEQITAEGEGNINSSVKIPIYLFIHRSVSLQGFLDAERKMNVKQREPEKEPILSSIQVTDKPMRSGDIKVFMFGANNYL